MPIERFPSSRTRCRHRVRRRTTGRHRRGFTIIELLVVLAVLGLLLAIAAPRYSRHVDTAREVTLKRDLQAMRDAVDHFHADRGRYPVSLDELVAQRYLHAVPVDPVTARNDTWRPSTPPDGTAGIYDVHSGAPGTGQDGSAYGDW